MYRAIYPLAEESLPCASSLDTLLKNKESCSIAKGLAAVVRNLSITQAGTGYALLQVGCRCKSVREASNYALHQVTVFDWVDTLGASSPFTMQDDACTCGIEACIDSKLLGASRQVEEGTILILKQVIHCLYLSLQSLVHLKWSTLFHTAGLRHLRLHSDALRCRT